MELRYIVLLWTFAAALTAQAANTTSPGPVKAYNKAAAMNDSSTYTELSFRPGSEDLTVDARNQLRELLERAQAKGSIAEVKVMAWADKEYPKGSKQSLDRASRRIADARGMEIENYFTDNAKGTKVTRYNMAEKPDALEVLFNTSEDARVKKSLEATGLAHPESSGLPKKASRALVMVVLK